MSFSRSLGRVPPSSILKPQSLLRATTTTTTTTTLTSTGLPIGYGFRHGIAPSATQGIRWYSPPVRSKVHMPPPPQRIGRRGNRSSQQREQQNYYEPEVQYSYPQDFKSPLQGNSPGGGIIQYSDGVAELLSQPVLVIERQVEFMNVILVWTDGFVWIGLFTLHHSRLPVVCLYKSLWELPFKPLTFFSLTSRDLSKQTDMYVQPSLPMGFHDHLREILWCCYNCNCQLKKTERYWCFFFLLSLLK